VVSKRIIVTSDAQGKEATAISSWIKNPDLDGYGWWSILAPFWRQGIEVDVLSPQDYLSQNPDKYLFALVFSKDFADFPRWKGKLVAYVHDPQSVTNYSLEGYSAVLAAYPKFTRRYALETGYDFDEIPVLWHPNLISPTWTKGARQRSWSTRKSFLVTGAIHPYYYPERYRLHQCIRFSLRKWIYGVHCSHKVGASLVRKSRLTKGERKGLSWFKYLAFYQTVIFAKDRWGLFVRKYTEIPGCGCLMVAPEIEAAKKAGLVDGENYIAIDVDRFWDIVGWIRDNPSQADKIRKNGIDWVHGFAEFVYHVLTLENIDIIVSN